MDDVDTETKNKLEYIGSVLASIVIILTIVLIALAATGQANLEAIPQNWFVGVVVPVVIMSTIEAFGKDVYNIFRKNN